MKMRILTGERRYGTEREMQSQQKIVQNYATEARNRMETKIVGVLQNVIHVSTEKSRRFLLRVF